MIDSWSLYSYSVHSLAPDVDWDENLREQFLIRTDVTQPKSVDMNVWWPEFGMWDFFDEYTLHRVKDEDRKEFLRMSSYSSEKNVMLTAHILDNDLNYPLEKRGFSKAKIDPNDYFIGYEVIKDASSTLSNCAYKDMANYRKKFRKHINDHGLFDELHFANEFREFNFFNPKEQNIIALYLNNVVS